MRRPKRSRWPRRHSKWRRRCSRRSRAVAGFDSKVEHDRGTEFEKGRILASTMIKDNKPLINKSKVGLAQVTESVQNQESEEVDEDHVSGQSRKAAEEYFRTMKND